MIDLTLIEEAKRDAEAASSNMASASWAPQDDELVPRAQVWATIAIAKALIAIAEAMANADVVIEG